LLWQYQAFANAGCAMSQNAFKIVIAVLGATFAVLFLVLCVPPLVENPDVIGAAMAGFVNPFASGYALDAIFCWLVLSSWVAYEAKASGIRHGWVCVLLGIVPGVATGFAAYLLLRMSQQATNHSLEGRRP
jgi:hypothetical protein